MASPGEDSNAAADEAMPPVEGSGQQPGAGTGGETLSGETPSGQTPGGQAPSDPQEAAFARIEQLLRVKDDTSRFVALALLKAALDNQVLEAEAGAAGAAGAAAAAAEAPSPSLLGLWDALPVKFLDKLLRAGLNAPPTPFITSSSPSASSASPQSKQPRSGAEAAHMRDLAVAVLHTFAVRILPDDRRGDARLVGRIPLLVASLLNTTATGRASTSTSTSTNADAASATTLILQTLATLVSRPEGAAVFNRDVADLSPLTELAPEEPLVLEILLRAWLYGLLETGQQGSPDVGGAGGSADGGSITNTINTTLPALVAAFTGTDGVTLLDFLAKLLRNAEAFSEQQQQQQRLLLPAANPAWLRPVGGFIRRLAASRPTAATRAAYTHASAALLRAYPDTASTLLFGEEEKQDGGKARRYNSPEDKPFAYLLISMLLVDLRATLPGLLAQLNNKDYYPATASRLASAYDILSAFIGYLMRSLESGGDGVDELFSVTLTPENLLRLRKTMSETLSVTAEHLRDRWDAAVAGAQGLHPDARSSAGNDPLDHALDAAGPPLAWDAADSETVASRDPLVLAAVRALALWLREDDNEVFRREAAGLMDMFLDLYSSSSSSSSSDAASLDFRRPVLVALEGITALAAADDGGGGGVGDDGYEKSVVALLLEHGAWTILTTDLLAVLQSSSGKRGSAAVAAADAARGIEIVRVLLPIVEAERPGTQEAWMDVVTLVAAWAGPSDGDSNSDPDEADAVVAECRVAVLQLVTALVANAHPSMCRRYTHSISAVIGLARQLRQTLAPARIGPVGPSLLESLDDVQTTLENARQ